MYHNFFLFHTHTHSKLPFTKGGSTSSYEKNLIPKIILVITVVFLLYYGISYFIDATGLRRHVNPAAVLGYPKCEVDLKMLYNFSAQYPCNIRPKPNPSEDVLIVTFLNSAWIPMARNWISSADNVGLKGSLYLIGLQSGVCSQVVDMGVPCYEDPNIDVDGTVFGRPKYQKLVIERTKIILKLLSCWSKIVLVDADISFLQNPLDYLKRITESKDIVFQADSTGVRFLDAIIPYVFRYICGGFIYMKSTLATKHLWLSVLNYQTKYLWNDQAGLNICVRHHHQTVQWGLLDSEHFPDGKQYFSYQERSSKNMIVHANHLKGTEKILRMIACDIWFHKPSAIDTCRGESYRIYCFSPQDSYTEQWCDKFAEVCREKYSITVDQS